MTVSAHFGIARHYLVYSIEGEVVKGKEVRDKVGHGPGENHHRQEVGAESSFHDTMLSSVSDCGVVISGGLGRPMFESIAAAGMKPILTRIRGADEAVKAFMDGSLDNHSELVH